MNFNYDDYWNTENFLENIEINQKNIQYTIDDLTFFGNKILVCGRGEKLHPDFSPKFSTPTTNTISDLYITVDHDPKYSKYINQKGNYALSLIVNPKVAKKIIDIGGKIFWFGSEEIEIDIPKIIYGEYPKGNSGLAAISIASYLKAKSICLSGIKFTDQYKQFIPGKDKVFEKIICNGTTLYSLDGLLAKKINFDDWSKL
jgi:hypothetical protein